MKTIPTVKGYSYTVASDQPCEIKDAASGKLLGTAEDGKPCTFRAQSDKTTLSDDSATYTANFNSAPAGTAPAGTAAAGGGKYVTVQVRGVKKVNESAMGVRFSRFLTSASGWEILDPQGLIEDLRGDCGAACSPGWLFRELWERPSGDNVAADVLVGWEYVLLAGEEEYLLPSVQNYAAALEVVSGGFNTLHVKKIYHD